ncbi:MAG: hypothetical protein ACR2IE_16080 [Candidatus Sumerlaeaceae bacterium]
MLPLASTQEPMSTDEFKRAVNQGLSAFIKLPRAGYAVIMEGDFPGDLDSLTIDLNGAIADPSKRPEPPSFRSGSRPAFIARKFHLHALPLRVGIAPLDFELSAEQMKFDYRSETSGKLWLVPNAEQPANAGRVHLSLKQRDLQEMLLSGIAPAAKEYGVGIEDVQLKLDQRGPRKIRAELQASAKKFMMKAAVHLGATVEIDDELNATVSELNAGSEGMIGTMVSTLIGPKLQQYNGHKVSLAAASLGGLRLRDLQIRITDSIQIDAQFGTG